MMTRTRSGVMVLLVVVWAGVARAADITWNLTTGGDWDTTSHNWTGGSPTDTLYVDPGTDHVTFDKTNGGTITIQEGGVSPLSTTVSASSGTYLFAGGNLQGSGELTKSGGGTLQIGQSYTGLVYTGNTRIDGGVLRIDHNSTDGHPSNRSLAGTTVLDGGTLRFQHTGLSYYNATLSFTSPITVTSAGGTIDFRGGANNLNNTLRAPSLGGNLTVSGVTGNAGVMYNLTSGTLGLTASATIVNATGPDNSHTLNLSPNLSGSSHTLTLDKSGSGTGFRMGNVTSTSLDIGNLAVGGGVTLEISSSHSQNPLAQLTANNGVLTMGAGSTLIFYGTDNSATPVILDPAAIVWSGGNTLTFPCTSWFDSSRNWRIVGDLEVSAAGGLTQMNYSRHNGVLAIDAPHALIVGEGGTLGITVGSGIEDTAASRKSSTQGHISLLDGAVVEGSNANNSEGGRGGLLRTTSGTLTLGDGSGTPAAPSLITVRGNHGATITNTFLIGYADNVVESGSARLRYANTGPTSNHFFNVGWTGTGSQPTSRALRETSGGTEFAPLAGSGGLAVVGPTAGAVASLTNTATLISAGTVGFYNSAAANTRGALGALNVAAGGALAFATNGTVRAADVTFENGAEWRVALYSNDPAQAGLLEATGELVFDANARLVVVPRPGATPKGGPWTVATFGSRSGLPKVGSGYALIVEGNALVLEALPSGSLFLMR